MWGKFPYLLTGLEPFAVLALILTGIDIGGMDIAFPEGSSESEGQTLNPKPIPITGFKGVEALKQQSSESEGKNAWLS